MYIDSNNRTLSGGEKVEEPENNPSLNKSSEIEEPKKGMCFTSKQGVHEFYAKYAKNLGFAIAYRTQNVGVALRGVTVGANGKVKYFGIECTRAQKRTKRSEVNPLKPSLLSKIDYKTKRILTLVKRRLEINDEVGIGVSRNFHSIVVEAGGYEALTFDERDAMNHIKNARRLRLGVGDAESVAFYFHKMQQENSNFYSAIDFDARHRWCLWHIMKKIPEKLRGYSQYEAIKFALQNAVYDSFTKDEFDEE
ncbi:uncharacterized protein LOC114258328 [Camellia sinensis]|uniref:uncharacterized protein LOC114258328 n=1 Tax=Camellia sinensis TaxID=4442 RepID=UPI0010369A57|nr:uncharacterized protein LOC114258328 [Camellia sinensis]